MSILGRKFLSSIKESLKMRQVIKTNELFKKHDSSPAPLPVRVEFISSAPLDTAALESIPIHSNFNRQPTGWRDKIALKVVKSLRVVADAFFRNRYIHRAIVLETVAAVPGMVAGMHRHMRSLRTMKHDGGWIHRLLSEAENERMHLMTWMKLTKPSFLERTLVFGAQAAFFTTYGIIYILAPSIAHRIVGYLEEEAIVSYTRFIEEIDKGKIENLPAPEIAIKYWNLHPEARLRDVVIAVRADEAAHRDTNHHMADRIELGKERIEEAMYLVRKD